MPRGVYERAPRLDNKNRGQVCGIIDCDRPAFCREVCKLHYRRWKTQRDRLWAWVAPGDPDECLSWTGLNRSDTRPCIMWRDIATRKESKVHAMRALMLIEEGPLFTTKLEAAHTCHNKLCVNINHGVWATHEENMAMSSGKNHWSNGK